MNKHDWAMSNGTVTQQKLLFERQEKERAAQAKKEGKTVTGYKTLNFTSRGPNGMTHRKDVQQAIYSAAPKTVTKTVYKDRPVAAKPKPKAPPAPVQLSNQAAEANAYTDAYEKVMLPRQGDYVIKNDQSVAQDFKNKYEANLTNELREKVPGALEGKSKDIKQKDAYSLNLGTGLSLF